MNILHLDSSARKAESVSRKLTADLVKKIKKDSDEVIYRDISGNIP
ncbi:MAG: FMN-dependent NADH-azoreductase, partial [Proteobacteria bacterium]|nr:FMN-dependent NADH-azoreductase [Pseudomonadota bacterium]